jgi:hypothetical protein
MQRNFRTKCRKTSGLVIFLFTFFLLASITVSAVTNPPVLWTAGGLSGGNDSAGQASRVATDLAGNVAIVSGPSGGRNLAVTSYTADGTLRWQSTVSPASGTFVGGWVAAAPNGDFVATGQNIDSHGRPILGAMVRYSADGTFLWRVDLSAPFYPSIARLLVDSAGNEYVAWSAVGSGMYVQKYSPTGSLLWSQQDVAISGYAFATSLALSPDGADVAASGSVSGGAIWITSVYDTTTGNRRWQVAAAEGTGANDVVVDATRVYVTGTGVTDPGTPKMKYNLRVVAYNRATGARLWRKDKMPVDGTFGSGLRMAIAPDGSLVATGMANRGFLDWYTVAFETTGAVRWEAVRDGGLNTDEIPQSVLVLANGTTVVTGPGGPNLPGGYIPGVTAGYSSNGTLLWEAFSKLATVWAAPLPNGSVCSTGGYDAFISCWQLPGAPSAPTNLVATSTTAARIDLTWTNTASDAKSISVERCRGGACTKFVPVAQLDATASSWADSTVTPKAVYRYRVRASNAAGNSLYSNIAKARAR